MTIPPEDKTAAAVERLTNSLAHADTWTKMYVSGVGRDDLRLLLEDRKRLREAFSALSGDREVQPLSEERLDHILEFEERVGQLAGPDDSATLTWADQRALIAEAVLAYRARAALSHQEKG